ncbi:MAG TPA: AsnC family transcriptional regulator [Acidiferrobacterales bacterium]|jgi:DNA-binding Lrp family transcriptional regulator
MELSDNDRRLVAAIQHGLPLTARPYAAVAEQLGMDESEVIRRIERMLARGVIKRLGVVVRHHELGYRANGMVVWDLPNDSVDAVGRRIKALPFVTLCYRRPRRPPDWPYNLFCMIHGHDRDEVLANLALLRERCGLEAVPHEVLFSRRRYKQRGAQYVSPPAPSAKVLPLARPGAG